MHPLAAPEVIDAAYKTLRGSAKPGLFFKTGDKDLVARLDGAYEVLSDPGKRTEYDEHLRGTTEGKPIGNYRLVKKISEGGFAETYLAEHIDLKTPACIKLILPRESRITPEDVRILENEAQAIWDLRHHALPAMREFHRLPDGSAALVMSYIPGPTLEQMAEDEDGNRTPLHPELVCRITDRVLDGLRYLHYHGVVHGDVKPSNIIVKENSPTVVLVDYGLSLVRPTRKDAAIGYTEAFASPEHQSGLPLLPESDFYSLGLTMIYALGGDLKRRRVPTATPDPLTEFIRGLIVHDVTARPNWEKMDLLKELGDVREKSFGRRRSNNATLLDSYVATDGKKQRRSKP